MWAYLRLVVTLALLGSVIAATHADRFIAPRLIEPNHCTVWQAGESATVSWQLPCGSEALQLEKGVLALGTLDPGAHEAHVQLGQVLATDFQLGDGEVEVAVPCDLEERQDYVLVLFGSHIGALGGISDRFWIASAEEPDVENVEQAGGESGQLVLMGGA